MYSDLILIIIPPYGKSGRVLVPALFHADPTVIIPVTCDGIMPLIAFSCLILHGK